MNKTEFIGNLGRDPEMRYTPSGSAVTTFSVACTRKYTNQGGEVVRETTWYRVSAWGKLAEVCNQYLKKGSKVYINGALTPDKETGGPRIWTDQGGAPKSSYEVRANEVEFLSSKMVESESSSADDLF